MKNEYSFNYVLESSIYCQPRNTRIVWIFFLIRLKVIKFFGWATVFRWAIPRNVNLSVTSVTSFISILSNGEVVKLWYIGCLQYPLSWCKSWSSSVSKPGHSEGLFAEMLHQLPWNCPDIKPCIYLPDTLIWKRIHFQLSWYHLDTNWRMMIFKFASWRIGSMIDDSFWKYLSLIFYLRNLLHHSYR